jgi:FdhD protein
MGRVTSRRLASHLTAGAAVRRPEIVVVEEPLEIRVNGTAITVTMRTPGSDVELAQGFLMTEGLIKHRSDIHSVRYCRGAGDAGFNTYNVLDVTLATGVELPAVDITRNFYMTSACGVCGKASLDAVRLASIYIPGDDPCTVAATTLATMPAQLRSAQKVFKSTGGLHGAALLRTDGRLLVVREDVGRHNAVDKVIGWALEHHNMPLTGTVLLVSGRVSFELTQKAVMAGIPILAAVSAPSSLAVELAAESGLTLVAFLRGESMNVYTCPARVTH